MKHKLTFQVVGMHCGACVQRVTDAAKLLPEVSDVEVTLDPPVIAIDANRPISHDELSAAANTAGDYHVVPMDAAATTRLPNFWATYRPLLLLLAFLLTVTMIVQFRSPSFDWRALMADFMGGFFLAFAFFKLLDLSGFARTFRTYDLLAAAFPPYAWAYPFLELALGIAYLMRLVPTLTGILTLAITLIGLIGVGRAVRQGEKIQCACLGTVFNLPMSSVTIVENASMAIMALAMLILH